MTQKTGAAGKIAQFFINSKLTPLFIIAAVLLGIASVIALPREEEPQIIVPMIDIFVKMPYGNVVVGNSGRRICIFNLQPGHVHGGSPFLRGSG